MGSFQGIGFRSGFLEIGQGTMQVFSQGLWMDLGRLGFDNYINGLGLFWNRIRFSEDLLDDIVKMLRKIRDS